MSAFPRFYFFLSTCIGWYIHLRKVLFPLISHFPSYFSLLDGVSAFSTSYFHLCEPVLDGLSVSPRSCFHLFFIFSHCPFNCLPLSPFLFPRFPSSPVAFYCFLLFPHIVPVLDGVSDMDYNRLQETLSPHVSHCLPHVRLCWMLCPPSRGLVSFCLPLFPRMYACVGRYVPLPKVLSPLVSHSFSICMPVMFCVGWYVRLPAILSSLFPNLSLSWSSFLSPNMSPNLSVFLFPFVVGGLILHFFSNSELIGVLNIFLRCLPWCWTVCPPARGLVSYLISQFVSLLVSLYGGWFHFAFFPKECAIEGS